MHINLENSVIFKINSCLDCVADVVTEIAAFCRQHKLDDSSCFQLEVCVAEAINNVIIHAYKNQADKKIHIKCELENKCLIIKISDKGKRMDQAIPKQLTASENESGRGWYIMQQWTDSVEYLTRNNVNTVILKKFLK